jgi:hypothetical protein
VAACCTFLGDLVPSPLAQRNALFQILSIYLPHAHIAVLTRQEFANPAISVANPDLGISRICGLSGIFPIRCFGAERCKQQSVHRAGTRGNCGSDAAPFKNNLINIKGRRKYFSAIGFANGGVYVCVACGQSCGLWRNAPRAQVEKQFGADGILGGCYAWVKLCSTADLIVNGWHTGHSARLRPSCQHGVCLQLVLVSVGVR